MPPLTPQSEVSSMLAVVLWAFHSSNERPFSNLNIHYSVGTLDMFGMSLGQAGKIPELCFTLGPQLAHAVQLANLSAGHSAVLTRWNSTDRIIRMGVPPDAPICVVCSQPWSIDGKLLMRCSVCQSRAYCSPTCQKSYVLGDTKEEVEL